MCVDRKGSVRGIQGLGERDEVEEDPGERGRQGDGPPSGAVIECCRQHRESGYAVEDDRDSEPEERHKERSAR